MKRRGFSIVEVLAAIAMISVAMIPLYQLQRSLADAAFRLDRSAGILDARQNALAMLDTINPNLTPSGEMQIGAWTMRWTASAIAEVPLAQGYRGQSIYAVGLYELEVELENGPVRDRFTLRKLGWRQVRDPLQF